MCREKKYGIIDAKIGMKNRYISKVSRHHSVSTQRASIAYTHFFGTCINANLASALQHSSVLLYRAAQCGIFPNITFGISKSQQTEHHMRNMFLNCIIRFVKANWYGMKKIELWSEETQLFELDTGFNKVKVEAFIINLFICCSDIDYMTYCIKLIWNQSNYDYGQGYTNDHIRK